MNSKTLLEIARGDDVIPLYHAALALLDERDEWRGRYQQALLDAADDTKLLREALLVLVSHIELNGGCHKGCPEHEAAKRTLEGRFQ